MNNMKKLSFALAVISVTACNGRFGGKTTGVIDDGHNYQWVAYGNTIHLVHSPECDSCKVIRKRETIAVIDSIVKERINIVFKQAE